MKLLAFESCGPKCGVALADEDGTIGSWDGDLGNAVAGPMLTAVHGLMQGSGFGLWDIDAFVACTGPGSFTGIKIAVTLAKTLAQALDAQVIGVGALDVLAADLRAKGPVAAVLPSKTGWIYLGRYEDAEPLDEGATMPIEELCGVLEKWTSKPGLLTGPIELPELPPNWEQVGFIHAAATGVARLALKSLKRGLTMEPAALVPRYIASYSISTPKKPLGPR